ncbi:MAG: sigma-70 family RNA polymerase sigma factor [Myxococcota bacterium]
MPAEPRVTSEGREAQDLVREEARQVERARSGDRKAFRWLVERHEGRVVQLARRQLRDEEAARDVAQEVFIKAYRNLDRFEGRARFSTWLYRLTVNQCHDWRRREMARPTWHSGDAGTDEVEALVAPVADGDPARASERADLRRGIALALEALPEEMRTTLILREVDDLAYAEIAQIQDIPKGTVMSRLHNARRRLRAELEALGWAPGGPVEEESS